MIWRAVAVWFVILLLANLNGAVRQAWLVPRLGEPVGRMVSTLALSAIVILVAWLTIGWIGPVSTGDAIRIGALWLGLTLAFEFLVGHYVFGQPWVALLEEYDITRGRIWLLVLLIVLFAPFLTARAQRLW